MITHWPNHRGSYEPCKRWPKPHTGRPIDQLFGVLSLCFSQGPNVDDSRVEPCDACQRVAPAGNPEAVLLVAQGAPGATDVGCLGSECVQGSNAPGNLMFGHGEFSQTVPLVGLPLTFFSTPIPNR